MESLRNASIKEQRDTLFVSYRKFLEAIFTTSMISFIITTFYAALIIGKQIVNKTSSVEIGTAIAPIFFLVLSKIVANRIVLLSNVADAIYGEDVFEENDYADYLDDVA